VIPISIYTIIIIIRTLFLDYISPKQKGKRNIPSYEAPMKFGAERIIKYYAKVPD